MTQEQQAAAFEQPFIALNARFIRGERLNRREQRKLHLYLQNKIHDELEHICHSLGADARHKEEEVSDGGLDDD